VNGVVDAHLTPLPVRGLQRRSVGFALQSDGDLLPDPLGIGNRAEADRLTESVRGAGRRSGRPPCLAYTRVVSVRLEPTPAPAAVPDNPLDDVLRRVNALRTAQAADPIYALPAACTAWDGGGCVLERAFEDLGVVVVDYQWAYGRGIEFRHGLGDFIRAFDSGRFPALIDQR
jgi:hypothetical protein